MFGKSNRTPLPLRLSDVEATSEAVVQMDQLAERLNLGGKAEVLDYSLKSLRRLLDLAGEDGIVEIKGADGEMHRFRLVPRDSP